MVDWLLVRYDHLTRFFILSNQVNFEVAKHDVYDVFMLPCTGVHVPVGSNDKGLLAEWRRKYDANKKGEISLEKLKAEMLRLEGGGEEFKKLFVLFAMGAFLAPQVHKRIDVRLIAAVEDVGAISTYDWCSYVLDKFDLAVKSWVDNNSKSMGGCLMFFQLLYFHRLVWRGLRAPSALPLIQHWTYDAFKERMREELKAYKVHRTFGIGVWDCNTYPVSLNLPKTLYRVPVNAPTSASEGPARQDVGLQAAAHEVSGTPKAVVEQEAGGSKPRGLFLPLPDDLPTDEELREKYADDRVLKWMTTKRNQQLVARVHHQMELEIEAALREEVEMAMADAMADEAAELDTSKDNPFYTDFIGMGKRMDEMVDTMITPPSFDLGIDDIIVPTTAKTTTYALRYTRRREAQQAAPRKPVKKNSPKGKAR
ncbi:uncharacterized protein LOC141656364 [Silene latifolia]|uniref:uncharacterized protein LOC141656364 n=1 Tax=Silene latifolia TaxID=37657 RepID=UPI003D779C93